MSDTTRARGTGRIFKPKRCRFWYIRYYAPQERVTRTGRRTKMVTESTGSTKRSVAERMLRDRLARKDRGETIINPSRVTFEHLEQMILDDYATNGRRLPNLKGRLKRLRAFFGGERAVSITTDRWQRYVATRQAAGASASTIMSERAALRRMFTLAVRAQRLPGAPYLPPLTVDNVRERVLDDADVTAVLEELPEDVRGAIEFGALTGWRVHSEVLPLTWDRVDLTRGVIRWEVGTTKNKAGRVLVFDALPALRALLQRWRAITDGTEATLHRRVPWVFHRDGRAVQTKRFYKAWHAACARAELLDARPHDLRRAAVMRFERAGVPRSVAMSVTGHKTESTYRRYNIVREAEQREGLAKVAAVLRKAQ